MVTPGRTRRRIPQLARAFRHRNYRLYFAGQGISVIGTWITRVATSWLVYRLTHSAVLLGLVGFAGQIPTFLLAPVAGVWVDRLNRYRVLFATQTLAMLQSFALAALALTGVIQVWHIVVLQILQGLINAFDMPARQTFLLELVENPSDLPNAIALNSSMVNGARLVGPAIAGVLIAGVGEGWCFLVDGVSYLAVIGSLVAMHVATRVRAPRDTRVVDELRAGIHYAAGFLPIRAVLLLLAIVGMMGMPYTVLMPITAATTLHGGPHTYGFLMGASGVGALAGALYLASRQSVRGLVRLIPVASAVFGGGLIAFALSRVLWLSLLLLVCVGGGFMVQMAASNTVLQTLVRDEMRGRVMSFYTMAFMGTAPLGSLLAGELAARVGAPTTIAIGGSACIVAAVVFTRALPALREQIRPIYLELGIIPTSGVAASTQLQEEMEQ